MEEYQFETPDYSAFQQGTNESYEDPYDEFDEEVSEAEDVEKADRLFQGADGTYYTEDEWESPAVMGGPLRKEVEGWKKKYNNNIYFLPFDNGIYVFRTLLRPEYREIIRDSKLTALDREERIADRCVLFPYDFSMEKMESENAGNPSLLSEVIMEKSGFVAKTGAIRL